MKRSLIFLTCALTAACADTTFDPSQDGPVQLGKGGGRPGGGGGGGNTETPLKVTFNDAAGLTSDDGRAYFHDDDKVRAVLRANGNLNFDAADIKGKKSPIRCVTVTVGTVFGPECVDLQLNTNNRFEGDVVLKDMNVPSTGTTTGAAGWEVDGVVHKVRYGRNCGSDLTEVQGKKITATRTSDTQWHLTGSSALYCVGGTEVSSDARVDFDVTLEVIN